jgi:flagellar protein FlaJ
MASDPVSQALSLSPAYLPLAVALAGAAVLALVPVVGRLDRAFGRLAIAAFGRHVRRQGEAAITTSRRRRTQHLRGARQGGTYRLYATKTLLYASAVAVLGSVLAVYGVVGLVRLLDVPATQLARVLPGPLDFLAEPLSAPTFSAVEAFALLVVSGGTVGVGSALAVFRGRWWWPRYRADLRGRQIDASLERTVAVLYALSRSGMSFPEVLRIVTRNQDVYGEAARELEVVIREIDLFGADINEALQELAEQTPSDEFGDFCDNLGSVLRSGRDLGSFLRGQHEQYRAESETRQSQFLELLGTLAEGYVTGLVAGPLFLLTILVVVGLLMGQTLPMIAALVYVLVPGATALVLLYLDSLSVTGGVEPSPTEPEAGDFGGLADVRAAESEATTDGGVDASRAANETRYGLYRRFRWLLQWARDPVQNVRRRPASIFGVTVPLAVGYVLWGVWPAVSTGQFPAVARVDDLLVHGGLFVGATFAAAYEARRRRLRAIERSVPDFLSRLAAVNEAGMPISESLGQVVRSDVGALDEELRRTWADVQWGARVESALSRLDGRVRSVAITRAVTLIVNSLRASGNVGPVLRIAADEAQATRRLARERRQEMLTYTVVIYVSFFVFLAIVVSLNVYFIPNVPTAEEFTGDVGSRLQTFGDLTAAQKDAYKLLFFHGALVQGVCSGLVAGEMGGGDVRAGAKHATAMLAIGYVVFLVLGG